MQKPSGMRPALGSVRRDRIELDDPSAVRHFTRVLGCSERELREAVAAVGPCFANVRLRFRRRPMTKRRSDPARQSLS